MGESGETIVQRLRAVEDELEIIRLISSYGLAVDAGDGQRAAGIWTERGVYAADSSVWTGRAEIAEMLGTDKQQKFIGEGSAHIVGVPHIRLHGDTAVATCYSKVFIRTDDGFKTFRVAANRFELVRTKDGWRTSCRTSRSIDGSPDTRNLLLRAEEE